MRWRVPKMSTKGSFVALMITVLLIVAAFPFLVRLDVAQSAGTVRDFHIATEYDLGGQGFNVFSSQCLVVDEGDQVNLTVRNLRNETFTLFVEGQANTTIQAANQNATGFIPSETTVPSFTASTPGIFALTTDAFPEMNVQLVVLPANFSTYSPPMQNRSFTQLVIPDFAGTGYDKFFPGVMVVNQGDTINVTVRNTDDMPHGFAIAAYNMSVGANPGQDQPNGTILPVTTSIDPFVASNAGIFRFLCTSPCGAGHFEMVGQLVVLPTLRSAYTPDIVTTYAYLTLKPDFAGIGYDRYVPDTIFANENDFVYIKVRNTDLTVHGLNLTDFGINNRTIAAAQNTTTGIVPTDTYLAPFFADQAGLYPFSCSFNCPTGNDQMNGSIVILPIQSPAIAPAPPTTGTGTSARILFIFLLISIATLIAGVVIGLIMAMKQK